MDKRSLVAIGFCIAFYLGYTQYLQIKYPDYGKPRPSEQAPQASPGAQPGPAPAAAAVTPAPAPEAATAGVTRLAPEQLVLETDQAIFRFSQDNGGLESVRLKGYKQEAGRDEPASVTSSPLAIQGVIGPDAPAPAVAPVFNAERSDRSIRFWREQNGIRITQEYRVPPRGYGLELDVAFANVGQTPVDLVAGVIASETVEFKESGNVLGFLPGVPVEIQNVVTAVDGDSEHHELRSFCESGERLTMPSAAVQFAGLDKHYFMALFLPKSKSMSLRVEPSQQSKQSCRISIATFEPQGNLQPGQAVTLSYGGFFGPKDLNVLSAFDEKIGRAHV